MTEPLTPLAPSPIALPPTGRGGNQEGGGAPLLGEGSATGEGTGVRGSRLPAVSRV